MKARLLKATGVIVLAWLTLAVLRAWQVDASVKEVAPYLYAPLLIVAGGLLGYWVALRVDPELWARAGGRPLLWLFTIEGVPRSGEEGRRVGVGMRVEAFR